MFLYYHLSIFYVFVSLFLCYILWIYYFPLGLCFLIFFLMSFVLFLYMIGFWKLVFDWMVWFSLYLLYFYSSATYVFSRIFYVFPFFSKMFLFPLFLCYRFLDCFFMVHSMSVFLPSAQFPEDLFVFFDTRATVLYLNRHSVLFRSPIELRIHESVHSTGSNFYLLFPHCKLLFWAIVAYFLLFWYLEVAVFLHTAIFLCFICVLFIAIDVIRISLVPSYVAVSNVSSLQAQFSLFWSCSFLRYISHFYGPLVQFIALYPDLLSFPANGSVAICVANFQAGFLTDSDIEFLSSEFIHLFGTQCLT